MSRGEYEKRWMAYIDGQLSAGEASAMDDSLDEAGRARIEAEMRLESALGDRLASGPACPEELWQRTLRMVDAAPARPARPWRPLGYAAAAAAAALVLALPFAYVAGLGPSGAKTVSAADAGTAKIARLCITEDSVKDFALRAQTKQSREDVERYLEEHDIRLALVDSPRASLPSGCRVKLLGSCMGNCPKGEIIEILYDVDGKPAKLVLARADSGGARLIRREEERGTVARTKVLGDYLAGVVCPKESEEHAQTLLDMIRVNNERVAAVSALNHPASSVV